MINIGEKFLNKKCVNDEWNGKELYNILMEFQDADAASGNPKLPKMENFYLKIHGWCNEKILDEHNPCKACPKNSEYSRYDNYNELIGYDNKETVVVLKSKYHDFREFKIFCAYYSTKEYKDEYKTMFELYGNPKTLWNKISDFFAKLFKINTL